MSPGSSRVRVGKMRSMPRTFEEALILVRRRVESTLAQATREDIFPHAAPSATGVWEGTREGVWTSGFWAGLLWQEAALAVGRRDAETATAWTLRLAPHLDRKTHDIGFVFASSAVLGWEIGQRTACRDLALAAADRLAGMFHPAAGVIPVGAQAEIAAGLDDVTIDCMVNLPAPLVGVEGHGRGAISQDRGLPRRSDGGMARQGGRPDHPVRPFRSSRPGRGRGRRPTRVRDGRLLDPGTGLGGLRLRRGLPSDGRRALS